MAIFGILAMIASLVITTIGLPAQIIKNYRTKSTAALSLLLLTPVFCAYLLWSLYGWTKPDLFLAVAQTPGCILSVILLGQYVRYR